MKIRKGFVSNSPSSSFVCDVCNEECSGMDIGLDDAGMYECSNGHIFCESHAIGEDIDFCNLSEEDKRKYCLVYMPDYCDKDSVSKMREEELDDFFDDEVRCEERYSMPPDRCPCCQFEAMAKEDMIEYLLYKVGQNKDEVLAEVKEKFGDYDTMEKELKK